MPSSWITLGTVAPGDVLRANSGTAAYNSVVGNINVAPRGILADSGTLTSTFGTSATHTVAQTITGMSLSVTYGANRWIAINALLNIYPNAGLQTMEVQFVRGSTTICTFTYDSAMLNASGSSAVTPRYVFSLPTGATETFTCKLRAVNANTQVSAFAAASGPTAPQRFYIEDLGQV